MKTLISAIFYIFNITPQINCISYYMQMGMEYSLHFHFIYSNYFTNILDNFNSRYVLINVGGCNYAWMNVLSMPHLSPVCNSCDTMMYKTMYTIYGINSFLFLFCDRYSDLTIAKRFFFRWHVGKTVVCYR